MPAGDEWPLGAGCAVMRNGFRVHDRRVRLVADASFAEPQLAEIYDPLGSKDRSDLDLYTAMTGGVPGWAWPHD
jgi:hypothetical protein